MAQPSLMSNRELSELVDKARNDVELWRKLKDRELEAERREAAARAQGKWEDSRDVILELLERPLRAELVADLLIRIYGPDHHFVHAPITMALRKAVRIELDLPV